MNKLPIARNTDVVVQTLGKEILIYDLNSHKAFNLNETSTLIFQACDGKTSFDELKDTHGFSDDLIFLALDELKKQNLIEPDAFFVSPFEGMSRREVIKRVGMGSMIALPMISFLVAPSSAQAQSSACITSNNSPCNCTVSQAAYDSGVRSCTDSISCDLNCACQGTIFSPQGNSTVAILGLCDAVTV